MYIWWGWINKQLSCNRVWPTECFHGNKARPLWESHREGREALNGLHTRTTDQENLLQDSWFISTEHWQVTTRCWTGSLAAQGRKELWVLAMAAWIGTGSWVDLAGVREAAQRARLHTEEPGTFLSPSALCSSTCWLLGKAKAWLQQA